MSISQFKLALFTCALLIFTVAAEEFTPEISGPSSDAENAIKNFQLMHGLKAELFAAEPELANPVGLCVDNLGRVYVLETFRAGLCDIDGPMGATLDSDMPFRTCDERAEFMKKKWGAEISKFTRDPERLRMLVDTNGDGRADRSTVFISSHELLDGIGAGVLAYKNDVYWANVPRLWKLRDNDGDGKADVKDVLHYGFGVHGGIRGHDLHGLRMGPDGKIYFSMGDRGFNITVGNKKLESFDTGGVLRCNPDGSDLEIFCTGLRNPEDLVFDEYGNLFTCDNDSGVGDKCRVMYLVEGSDNGWRNGFQFIHLPNPRGVWNLEKMWQTAHKGQPAFLIPAQAHLTNGPAGITYYPGTGLPDHFQHRFFLADFRYSAPNSGLHTFKMNPKGAAFEFADVEKSIWGILLTDADFGPDSQLYCSDWIAGGQMPKKGRVYRIFDPERAKSDLVLETKKLLNEGMEKRSPAELIKLLAHPNMMVRRDAQFQLAALGKANIEALAARAQATDNQLARIHAIWALGQIGRSEKAALQPLIPLLQDADAEIRAQAAKVLGDCRYEDAASPLIAKLKDENPRVRFFAAISVGKVAKSEALEPLLQVLHEAADADPFVRHAAVMGLVGSQKPEDLLKHASDTSCAVRMGILLALRRFGRHEVAQFLKDSEPLIVAEAARAIHDAPINEAMSALAQLIEGFPVSKGKDDPNHTLLLRVLNANFRVGEAKNAQALAAFVQRADQATEYRLEALRALTDWAEPHGRDRVLNTWRALPPRDPAPAISSVKPFLLELIKGTTPELQAAACEFAGKYKLADFATALHALACDENAPPNSRVAAFNALADQQYPKLADVVRSAMTGKESTLRVQAMKQLSALNANDAVPLLAQIIDTAPHAERQTAIGLLAKMQQPNADAVLAGWTDKLLAGNAPAEIQLDLIEAALASTNADLKKKFEQYKAKLPADDDLAPFKICLAGGDSAAGKKLFFESEKVQCSRCHKINGKGGEVGPDLSKVSAAHDRNYLLESLIMPNAQIAPGFEVNVAQLNDGRVIIGLVKTDNEKILSLLSADGKLTEIPKSEIKSRRRQKESAMPPMGEVLTKTEIRNAIEYLSTMK